MRIRYHIYDTCLSICEEHTHTHMHASIYELSNRSNKCLPIQTHLDWLAVTIWRLVSGTRHFLVMGKRCGYFIVTSNLLSSFCKSIFINTYYILFHTYGISILPFYAYGWKSRRMLNFKCWKKVDPASCRKMYWVPTGKHFIKIAELNL